MIQTEEEAREFIKALAGEGAVEKLEKLATLLTAENKSQNLVSQASMQHVWTRHFADSAQIVRFASNPKGRWLDLGSGAGFPGLVVAICCPDALVTLVESRKRRVDWLARMKNVLDLANCVIEGRRLELVETSQADVITARAFAPLAKLVGFAHRFSHKDTIWILPKGRSAGEEIAKMPRAVAKMFHVEQSLTDRDAKIIVGQGLPERSGS